VPKLKCDKEVVLAAVAQDGRALKYAPDEIKADHEVVRIALTTMSMGEKKALKLHKQDPIVKAIAKEDKAATKKAGR
jgi:hypothetical protein